MVLLFILWFIIIPCKRRAVHINIQRILHPRVTTYFTCFRLLKLGHFVRTRENDMHETDHSDEIKRNRETPKLNAAESCQLFYAWTKTLHQN